MAALLPCKHCNGTTICSASRDGAGQLKLRPACVCCVVKAGLNPKGLYDKVICSVCQGKGLVEPATAGPRHRPISLRLWLTLTPLLLAALAFFVFALLSYYRDQHRYDDVQDLMNQKIDESSLVTRQLTRIQVRGKIKPGMSPDDVRKQIGDPSHVMVAGLNQEAWNYRCNDGILLVSFQDDQVSDVR